MTEGKKQQTVVYKPIFKIDFTKHCLLVIQYKLDLVTVVLNDERGL